MNNKTKVAVIGGTGKSGTYLVRELIQQNFQIKVLVRNPNKITIQSPLMEIVQGNVNNFDDVYTLIQGCDAVISALGIGIPESERTIFSQGTKHVIQAMNAYKVKRYILLTGLNVDTPFDEKSPTTAFGTDWMRKNFPVSTADRQFEYELLLASQLDWTLVRLPLIEQTDDRASISTSLTDCPGDKISATDLAHFLIEQLQDRTYLNEAPFIANV